jgi:hypothetical protein
MRLLLMSTWTNGFPGAFIICLFAIYLFMRMKKIDVFSNVRNRRIRKGGERGIYGWRRDSRSPPEAPPQYSGEDPYGYPNEEKKYPEQRQFDGAFAPVTLPPLQMPENSLSRSGSQAGSPLVANAAPYGYSPQERTNPGPPISAFNNIGRRNTLLSRQASDANNNTMASQTTYLSRQTSNLRNGNQQETAHMSYLSSLSSGFGDGLICLSPDLTPMLPRDFNRPAPVNVPSPGCKIRGTAIPSTPLPLKSQHPVSAQSTHG